MKKLKLKKPSKKTWWIARTGKTIIHFGLVGLINVAESGQQDSQIFTNRKKWLNRLIELGVDTTKTDTDAIIAELIKEINTVTVIEKST